MRILTICEVYSLDDVSSTELIVGSQMNVTGGAEL